MKNRIRLVIINAAVVFFIIVFSVAYTSLQRRAVYLRQRDSFLDSALTMEHVVENYLLGEQGICDAWAGYISSARLTMDEAVSFIERSQTVEGASAHLIFSDTLDGIAAKGTGEGRHEVSYGKVDIFGDMAWIGPVGRQVNITRAFTNPVNGEQSIAFINRISVYDEGAGRDALLLRVVPVSELQQKWVFPREKFVDTEISLIDAEGNYIIRGKTFKNTNFYEFYFSYNPTVSAEMEQIKELTSGTAGLYDMTDSKGNSCVLSHAPVGVSRGWVMLEMIPSDSLRSTNQDWLLVTVITSALLILLAVNILYMRDVNVRLQDMAEEAESANRAKTDFLSTMSHDIRTPMNAIIGLTTIAERNIDDKAAVSENLRKISLAGSHLLTLINDILDISKVESGRLNLSPLTFSIVETVENLVNISQPMVKEKNIDFSFSTDRIESEYLYADQLRINQIYINILSNALKYTEPGGSVSVFLNEQKSDKEGCVKLVYTVTDTGMGMSPEFMERMYQPFSRQTDSRVNTIQGTGLGLAITKQMVDLMGGTIECDSELGRGTTFRIVLDIPVAEKQPDILKLDPIDILVVDDDMTVLETASETLRSLGASAETASSGTEAIRIIEERRGSGHPFALAIVDWKMPDMNGVETVRRIRAELGEDLPILLISAYDWSDIEDEAKDAGANGFISKPLFRSVLYDKINELLGNGAARAEQEDDYSDIAGMNILIAEDNDINWEIIHTLLEMLGVSSERAVNGRVCVDMLSASEKDSYDLIFMDVQMPEMNGLDATRTIRSLKDMWACDIPIIAMTADAFSENVAECLAAGMNGHIAKPVDIKMVIKEIRRIKEERDR